jgi:hypothetical protein
VLEDGSAPPPPPPPLKSRPIIALDSDFALSEDAARSALLDYLGGHCCYGKAAAKNMVIKQMDRMPAFHYEVSHSHTCVSHSEMGSSIRIVL